MLSKIINSYKQFGLRGFSIRALRKLLSLIGIKYEDYYLLSLSLEGHCPEPVLKKDGVLFRELRQRDFANSFLNENYLMYTSRKMDLVETRFANNYESFGAFSEGKLVYASWISYETMEMPGGYENERLPQQTALLLDDFCAPHMRKKGIHSAVNQMRLNRLIEKQYRYVIVTVMCMNKPALKSHIRNGFEIVSRYYTLTSFGHKKSNLNTIMKEYEYNR